MADASTHTIKLKVSGVDVVFKDWITGADDEKIQAHYYNGSETDKASGSITYKPGTMQAADHEAIAAAVVSIDGSTEDVVNQVLNLSLPDTKQVLAEVKKITNPLVESE